MRDFEIIETELILKDLDSVERRWEKVHREAKSGIEEAKVIDPVVTELRDALRASDLLDRRDDLGCVRRHSSRPVRDCGGQVATVRRMRIC